jgi:hypothetical protein
VTEKQRQALTAIANGAVVEWNFSRSGSAFLDGVPLHYHTWHALYVRKWIEKDHETDDRRSIYRLSAAGRAALGLPPAEPEPPTVLSGECSVAGCGRTTHAKGYCVRHYNRAFGYGTRGKSQEISSDA